MKTLYSKINAGAEKPFKIIHISDTHLTYADKRDDGRKIRLAKDRKTHFPNAEQVLSEVEKLYAETGYMLVHTGDLIDFVSEANLDAAREFTKKTDCFTSAGNHEFSLYVGEAKEDSTYREQSLEKVQSAYVNDIRFSSKIVNGINFVAVDNSYYLIEPWQLERLKQETAKGLPVILCLHTPLYSEEAYDFARKNEGENSPVYLMSVPEEKMQYYSPERYEQQKEDETTHTAYEFIKNEPLIKAVLTGHIHCDFELPLGDKMQYGVGCEDIRIIDIY